MRIDVITIFPAMFEGVFSQSMLRIAREKGLLESAIINLRDYASGRHRSVDDRPFGGGAGMVLKVEPVVKAVRRVRAQVPGEPGHLVMPCPRGRVFKQQRARELAKKKRLIFLAAHYEGYDERIVELLRPERLSLGDYLLTGGELPALAIIDAVVRLLPGVLGGETSLWSESFAPGNGGLLEYPQYTRPAQYEGHGVPEVLLSGDHEKVAAWRRTHALEHTRALRPDLLSGEAQGAQADEARRGPAER